MVGAGLGTMIAGPFGAAIGGTIGGILGGFGGGWAGNNLASYGVNAYLELRDKVMEEERVRAIYALYGVAK
jgi:hypothetical protein